MYPHTFVEKYRGTTNNTLGLLLIIVAMEQNFLYYYTKFGLISIISLQKGFVWDLFTNFVNEFVSSSRRLTIQCNMNTDKPYNLCSISQSALMRHKHLRHSRLHLPQGAKNISNTQRCQLK